MGTELVLANTLCSKVTFISICTHIQCRFTGWSNQCNQVLTKPKSNILRPKVQTFVFFSSNTSPQTRSSGLKMTPPTQGAGAFAGVDSLNL